MNELHDYSEDPGWKWRPFGLDMNQEILDLMQWPYPLYTLDHMYRYCPEMTGLFRTMLARTIRTTEGYTKDFREKYC